MKNIAIVGANGKMGKLICEKLKSDFEVCKVTKDNSLNDFDNIDLVVDFSTAEHTVSVAKWCGENEVPLVIGTTGHSEEQLKLINEYTKNIKVKKLANFSSGIIFLEKYIKMFKELNVESITILEKHHKNKIDKPSGTAKEICKELKKYFDCRIDIFSIRGGDEIGTHEIYFYFGSEVIKISHQAFSRDAFVDGLKKVIYLVLTN